VDAESRLHDLEQFREYVDGFLRNESQFLSELHSDLEIDMVPMFAETFPPILHSSLITSTVALIELELRGYADALYTASSLSLRLADLSGSLLERFWRYTSKVAGITLDQDRLGWTDVTGLFELRNCIVHSGGSLSAFQGAQAIRRFALAHGTPSIEADLMTVDSKTSQIALTVASRFLVELFDCALRRFPGGYAPRSRASESA